MVCAFKQQQVISIFLLHDYKPFRSEFLTLQYSPMTLVSALERATVSAGDTLMANPLFSCWVK